MSSNDTAFKHLNEIISPATKDKPIPEAIKIFIAREEKAIEEGKKEPYNIFDMLKAAVEAKKRGESLKIKLVNQSMELESEPGKQPEISLKAMEIQSLGSAFQYQGMLFGEAMKANALATEKALASIAGAYKDANNVESLKIALKTMKQSNEMLVDRLRDREQYIEQLQKELSLGFKREKIAHTRDLKTMTDKHYLERQVLELEMMMREQEELEKGEETTQEEKEENLGAIESMMQEVEGIMDKAPQVVETVNKAKTMLDMAKGLFAKEEPSAKKDSD